jgi:hypothetical protein
MTASKGRLIVVGLAAVVVVSGGAAAIAQHSQADCSRTPITHSNDAVGRPIDEVLQTLSNQYATRPRFVLSRQDGPEAIELDMRDVGGDHPLGDVRVEKDSSGTGWLVMTENTCGD